MIQEGQQFILTKWHLSTIPGLAVVLTGLALALDRGRHRAAERTAMTAPCWRCTTCDVEIPHADGRLHAVRGVSLTRRAGEAGGPGRGVRLGQEPDAAGDARTCCRVPARIVSAAPILIDGVDVTGMPAKQLPPS